MIDRGVKTLTGGERCEPGVRFAGHRSPLNRHGEIPAGTIGTVLGWFAYEGTYIVNFRDEADRLVEVYPDEIVLAESLLGRGSFRAESAL